MPIELKQLLELLIYVCTLRDIYHITRVNYQGSNKVSAEMLNNLEMILILNLKSQMKVVNFPKKDTELP